MLGPATKVAIARSKNAALSILAVMVGGLLFADVRAEDKAASEPLYVSWDEDDPLCADIYRNRRRIEIIEPIRTTGHDASDTINEVLGYGLKELDPRNPPAKTVPYFTKTPMDRATIERLLAAQDWNTLFEPGEAPPDKGFLPGPIHTDPFWRDLHRRCPELLFERYRPKSPKYSSYDHAYTHMSLYRADLDGNGKDEDVIFGTAFAPPYGRAYTHIGPIDLAGCRSPDTDVMLFTDKSVTMFRFSGRAFFGNGVQTNPKLNLGFFFLMEPFQHANKNWDWHQKCRFGGPPSPRDLREREARATPMTRKKFGIGPYE